MKKQLIFLYNEGGGTNVFGSLERLPGNRNEKFEGSAEVEVDLDAASFVADCGHEIWSGGTYMEDGPNGLAGSEEDRSYCPQCRTTGNMNILWTGREHLQLYPLDARIS